MSETKACTYCDTQYDPNVEGGEDACSACYYEEYCFSCSWCEEYGDVTDQHAYVLVFEAEEAGVPLQGLYRIDHKPYYTQGLIGGGWLHPWALTWLGYLPDDREEPDGYPVGHACADCQRHLLDYTVYSLQCSVATLSITP